MGTAVRAGLAAALWLAAMGSAAAPPASPAAFDANVSSAGFFPRAEAGEAGVDPEALRGLLDSPTAEASDALIVVKGGRTVVERYSAGGARRLPLASVTKVVLSLAIMALIADGRVPSEDARVSRWIAGWNAGAKSRVSLRHVMTHTSGLACTPGVAGGDRILSRQADLVEFASRQPVESEPGTVRCYNNAAVELLAAVVRGASGKEADVFLNETFFRPMGIDDVSWSKDRTGRPDVYGGLSLNARELAKLGQLMLQEGRWGERALLPPEVVRRFTSPSREDPDRGYLWAVERERVESGRRTGAPIGFYHTGAFGAVLAVYPRWGLVAVRLRDRRPRAAKN
ncbi:MAG: beta-lactamase family protein, partial [Elusimicrobia bacterium]|nr:beta-lactamase family protein [Elusimicrobiota bacterium]